ncbi:MAG: TonB-dependent receptor [Tannerella sp.]|jgi:iron complex outermembrane receptor protein|nr:TonB-dependent receptor [Tannerella sp.]
MYKIFRNSLLILAINILSVSAYGYSQDIKVSIRVVNKPITEIFNAIKAQTSYSFWFDVNDVDTKRMVSVDVKNEPVSSVLKTILKDQNVDIGMYGNHIIIGRKGMLAVADEQQAPITVTGNIADEMTGEPLAGVNIVIKGTTTGVVSTAHGYYSIEVPSTGVTLVFSYVGYLTREIVVDGDYYDVLLTEDSQLLEEVVVVGYGTMTRKEITGSVTNVTAKDFNQGFQKTAADMLQGKVAGLTVNSGSGDVTSNAAIRLRGVTTFLNDQGPFFVIDNIPGADLSTVAPQDIESISVLKDASAGAIYGSRSAGGVILITTKKGSASKPSVTYSGAVGISDMTNKPDLFTADEWRSYASSIDGYDPSLLDFGGNTDWFKEITRTGIQQDHNLSLAGGSAYNNYRGSVSYMRRDGLARDNSLERYNLRLQFSQFALNNRMRIDLTAVTTMSDLQPTYARNFILAYNMSPVRPVKNDDGSWHESYDYDQGNPVRNQEENSRENKLLNAYATAAVNFTIIDGLETKLFASKIRNMADYSEYNSRNSEAGLSNGGFAQRSSEITNKNLLEWTATYNKTIGNHKLNLLAGYSWEQEDYASHVAQNRTFITDYLGANDLASGEGYRKGDVGSSKNSNRLISFYGRANYTYRGKYSLTATLRRDGSSKFGANHKWGTFPSVSAAWNVSDEGFMAGSLFNDLKLSAGWGVMGNQTGLSPYNSLELYGFSGTYYDNTAWHTGYAISQNANPDLRWEQTSMLNVGVDFGILKNRLSGRIEWYNKITSDMLYNYPVPTPPYMYSYMMANVGDMKNTGIELTLNATPVLTKDFSWDFSLNFAHNKNEVTKLSNEIYTTERQLVGSIWWRGGGTTTHILEVGKPIGQFYGLQCTGLDGQGGYVIVNQDDDEEISEPADYTYIGNAQPVFTYGLNNSFRYKNIDFSFFLRGVYGNDVLNLPRLVYAQPGFMPGANALDDPLTYELQVTPKFSNYYLEKGSYMRLDNMSLGYSFPKVMNGIRVYSTVQNLFVLTKYKGLDPELPVETNSGLAPGVEPLDFYPKARTFSIGLSVNF